MRGLDVSNREPLPPHKPITIVAGYKSPTHPAYSNLNSISTNLCFTLSVIKVYNQFFRRHHIYGYAFSEENHF